MELLTLAGEQPALVCCGSGKNSYFIALLPATEQEAAALAVKTLIKVGAKSYLTLPLEPGAAMGAIDAKLYDAAQKKWTEPISVIPRK